MALFLRRRGFAPAAPPLRRRSRGPLTPHSAPSAHSLPLVRSAIAFAPAHPPTTSLVGTPDSPLRSVGLASLRSLANLNSSHHQITNRPIRPGASLDPVTYWAKNLAMQGRFRVQTFLKSGALAIAAAAICLMLAVFVPTLVGPASSNVPPQRPTSEPRTGNDDFTVSTTEELISSQTWRSP